ncbi:MAG: extracellular solute-binding protein [Lachnospiraceae bacterium]|jgi:putative aldouronate transport system substrate-binding protein|nr:extracellular solute-binding protein [Lachnospiraceae bacterium]
MRKNVWKKGLGMLLALSMALTGCGSTGGGETKKPDSEPAAETSNAADESSTEENTEKTEEVQQPEEKLVITGMANLYNLAPEKDSEFWKMMEEKFNVDYTVDWVPGDTYAQKMELVLSSGELPDLMQIQNTTVPSFQKAVEAGAFYDLTDLLGDFSEYPNLKNNTNLDAWTLSKIKGRNYVVPRTRGNLDSAVMIRKDWLDKLGLEVPATMEEFADVIVKVAQGDPDGNGVNDTIGLIPGVETIDGYYPAAFGTRDIEKDADGGIIYERLTDRYGDYVEYMRNLYGEGAVAKEFALIKGQQAEELFTTGKSATLTKNAWHLYRLNEECQKTDPDAEVVLIPYLEGPGGYAHIYDLGYFGGMAISAKCSEEKVKQILKFFDATCALENYNFVNYGIEGVHWEMVDGDPSLTEQGKQEVTNSFNAPFIFAANEFAKVDSPLADKAYNESTRETMKALYTMGGTGGKIDKFNVLQSDTWTQVWGEYSSEFASMETKAISGAISMDEFRAYQKQLRENEDFKKAFQEFTQSHKEFFGE